MRHNNFGNIAVVTALVLLVACAGIVIFLWRSGALTNDILDQAETVDSQNVVIASKKLIDSIEGYSSLPTEARSSIVGVLQNACPSSNGLKAKIDDRQVAGKLIVVSANCQKDNTLYFVFAKSSDSWQKISEPNGSVSCENSSKYSVPTSWGLIQNDCPSVQS